MKVEKTELGGVLVIEPRVFRDERGFFLETFQVERYAAHGIPATFAQDNRSNSVRGTLRGLHFQEPQGQGKLVQVTHGTVFDVVVDVRRGSPTFGRWIGFELDGERATQVWIPPGFAHGFYVTSEQADFWYKCTTPYAPEYERSIRWDDPALAIAWPSRQPLVSKKDAAAPVLAEVRVLPAY